MKGAKGTVSVLVRNQERDGVGTIQLRWRHQGKRYYLSLGRSATRMNLKGAQMIAQAIERDILYERFDPSLAKYQGQADTPKPEKIVPDTFQVWQQYVTFREQSGAVAASTIIRDYGKVTKRLEKIPRDLKGVAIRDWLLRHYSGEIVRRTLIQLSAAYMWAIRSGIVTDNPVQDLAADLKKVRRKAQPEAFTAEERDAILNAIAADRFCSPVSPVRHSYYLDYICTLFWCGCRPEELSALTWANVARDFSFITIREALPADVRVLGKTKTGKSRKVPTNNKLSTLLQERFLLWGSNSYVFPSPRGTAVDSHNLSQRVWKPVVEALVKEGKVSKYLPLYACRHTFITLASVEAGIPVQEVAALVGNSPQTIYARYASVIRKLTLPDV